MGKYLYVLAFVFSCTVSFSQDEGLIVMKVMDSLYCTNNQNGQIFKEALISRSFKSNVQLGCDIEITYCDDSNEILKLLRKKKEIYQIEFVQLNEVDTYLFSLNLLKYKMYKRSKGKLIVGVEEYEIKILNKERQSFEIERSRL